MVDSIRRSGDQEIPEVLKDALKKRKERYFLLQLEKDLIGFIKDGLTKKTRKQQYFIKSKRLRNSYMRLLAHQICQYYWLEHWNNCTNDIIVTLSDRDISYFSLIEGLEDRNCATVIRLSDFQTDHSTHTVHASKPAEEDSIDARIEGDICYVTDQPKGTVERAESSITDRADGANRRSTLNHIAATEETPEGDKEHNEQAQKNNTASENVSGERERKVLHEHGSISIPKEKDSLEYILMHSHGELTDSNFDTTTTSTDIESRPETPFTNASTAMGGKYNSNVPLSDSLSTSNSANLFATPPVAMPVPLPYAPYQSPYFPQMGHHPSISLPMYMPYPQMLHTYPVGMLQPNLCPGFYHASMHTPYYDKETERKLLNNPYIIIPNDPKNIRKNKKYIRRKHSESPIAHHNKSTLDKASISFTK